MSRSAIDKRHARCLDMSSRHLVSLVSCLLEVLVHIQTLNSLQGTAVQRTIAITSCNQFPSLRHGHQQQRPSVWLSIQNWSESVSTKLPLVAVGSRPVRRRLIPGRPTPGFSGRRPYKLAYCNRESGVETLWRISLISSWGRLGIQWKKGSWLWLTNALGRQVLGSVLKCSIWC